jgi:hypothetical protein
MLIRGAFAGRAPELALADQCLDDRPASGGLTEQPAEVP